MTPKSTFTTFVITASALALAACSQESTPADDTALANDMAIDNGMMADNSMSANGVGATAQSVGVTGGDGASLGSVTVTENAGGVTMAILATGMPAGVHGIHLHEKGLCDGPTFESAGAHWNPTQKQHGRDNPAGAHAGDLANLTVAADGSASTSIPVAGAMMSSGSMMLADADGTALVVHAKPDDYRTDPSGNSGDRIACAVIAAPN